MFTKTTVLATRTLVHLAQCGAGAVLSPRRIAEALGASPTYLAKVSRLLVRAGVLHAEKGAKGGVFLAATPRQITLLAVVEACQGKILADYCRDGYSPQMVCAFHRAATELHMAVRGVLSRWNLAQLLKRPQPACELARKGICVLASPTPRRSSKVRTT